LIERHPPPLLLALESATSALSVALLRGDEFVDEESAPFGPAAEILLPAIDTLLGRAGVDLEALEAFAVSIGPGSFTSLRVGIATAKGLAFGTDRPVAPVSTLAALALAPGPTDAAVVPMLDARRGQVYAAAYAGGGRHETIIEAGVYTPDELAARLVTPCILVGEAVPLCGEAIRAELGDGVALLPPPQGNSRARYVGALGAEMLARGEVVDAAALAANYVRRAEAEAKRVGEPFEPAPGFSRRA
jgi:tRNA threonylcarbamoyladenosine biosynthesis protein TsaB